jgi:hypothetical protein
MDTHIIPHPAGSTCPPKAVISGCATAIPEMLLCEGQCCRAVVMHDRGVTGVDHAPATLEPAGAEIPIFSRSDVESRSVESSGLEELAAGSGEIVRGKESSLLRFGILCGVDQFRNELVRLREGR